MLNRTVEEKICKTNWREGSYDRWLAWKEARGSRKRRGKQERMESSSLDFSPVVNRPISNSAKEIVVCYDTGDVTAENENRRLFNRLFRPTPIPITPRLLCRVWIGVGSNIPVTVIEEICSRLYILQVLEVITKDVYCYRGGCTRNLTAWATVDRALGLLREE